MSDLRVVQLQDKNRNPITPYTAAASVYINVNNEWTSVESQIGGMDIEAVEKAKNAALGSIDEQKTASLAKIEEEGESYRNDIDALSGQVKTLDEKVFPLSLDDRTITANLSTMTYSYEYKVKEYGQLASGVNVIVKRSRNSLTYEQLYAGTESSKKIEQIPVTWGRDRFNIRAVKGTKSNTKDDVRYLCVYGAYGETLSEELIKNTSVMTGKSTTSASFSCTVNTTENRKYIWIAVPEQISISKITSGGFDVTMNNYVTIQVGTKIDNNTTIYNNYKAYRSKNPLQMNTWNLSVS